MTSTMPERVQTYRKSKRQKDTPAVDITNVYRKLVKWCTPSILKEVMENYNAFGEGSISISYTGKMQDNTGIYGTIHDLAAEAYGNTDGHSHYGYEGTTGATRVLFDLIAKIMLKECPDSNVLASRNVHQSVVINGLKNQVPIRYAPTRFDDKAGIFLPPTVEDIVGSIDEKTKVVLVTNPTYEGLSCDLKELVTQIKAKNDSILIYVDEAWGAHLAFHPDLPISGTIAGADFVVQSMHKQGGAPNPANITHLSRRVTEKYLNDFLRSYAENMSTTYSQPLIGAMDLARRIMYFEGENKLEYMIKFAGMFKDGIKTIKGIELIEPQNLEGSVHSYDPTKINIDVRGTGLTGDHISKVLERDYSIITEKEERNSLCFLTTFSIGFMEVDYTLQALKDIITNSHRDFKTTNGTAALPEHLEKRYETFEAERMAKKMIPLEQSAGQVLGENIKCYPPGIFVGQMGEVVNEELVHYLQAQRGRGHVCANDKSLGYVAVIEQPRI